VRSNRRNLKIAAAGVVELVNNVVYNWGRGGFELADSVGIRVNAVGNRIQSGDSTDNSRYPIVIGDSDKSMYVRDNV
jgi:hypothetical protein